MDDTLVSPCRLGLKGLRASIYRVDHISRLSARGKPRTTIIALSQQQRRPEPAILCSRCGRGCTRPHRCDTARGGRRRDHCRDRGLHTGRSRLSQLHRADETKCTDVWTARTSLRVSLLRPSLVLELCLWRSANRQRGSHPRGGAHGRDRPHASTSRDGGPAPSVPRAWAACVRLLV
jgi:hypothetical protein